MSWLKNMRNQKLVLGIIIGMLGILVFEIQSAKCLMTYTKIGYVDTPISCNSGDTINWTFSGSNPSIMLSAYLMDSNGFTNYQNDLQVSMHTLASGVISKSGSSTVDSTGTWYFVVEQDTVGNTVITNSATDVGNTNNPTTGDLILLISMIIAFVILFSIIGYYGNKKKKQKFDQKQQNQQQQQQSVVNVNVTPTVTIPQSIRSNEGSNVTVCSSCGTSCEKDSKFCKKCGSQL